MVKRGKLAAVCILSQFFDLKYVRRVSLAEQQSLSSFLAMKRRAKSKMIYMSRESLGHEWVGRPIDPELQSPCS